MLCSIRRLAPVLAFVAQPASVAPVRAQQATAPPPRTLAIRAAHLIDPAAGRRTDRVVVLLRGASVVSVDTTGRVPNGG
jgi:hypothetical protein